jgi:hypothetical protein
MDTPTNMNENALRYGYRNDFLTAENAENAEGEKREMNSSDEERI